MSEKLCALRKVGGGNTSANAYYVSGKTNATLNGTITIPTTKKAEIIYIIVHATDTVCYATYYVNISSTAFRWTTRTLNESRNIGSSNGIISSLSDNGITLKSFANTLTNVNYELAYVLDA